MVMIELLGVSAIDRSNVEESSEHHCTENLQEFSRSLLKATLALAILLFNSASRYTSVEGVLPRQVKLGSTACRFCPLTVSIG